MSRDQNNFGGGGPGGPFQGGGGYYPGMPYPGMPIIIRDGSQQQQPQQPVDPPLRAQIAMALNSHLSRVQQPQIAVTENHVEVVKGRELTEEEAGTQATAMNCMAHYLAGTLEPDVWERQSLQRDNGIPTFEFKCVCFRQDSVPNPECIFCSGDGVMDVVIRNPRRAMNDGNGNIFVQGQSSRSQNVKPQQFVASQTPPTPGPKPGKRPPKGPPPPAPDLPSDPGSPEE